MRYVIYIYPLISWTLVLNQLISNFDVWKKLSTYSLTFKLRKSVWVRICLQILLKLWFARSLNSAYKWFLFYLSFRIPLSNPPLLTMIYSDNIQVGSTTLAVSGEASGWLFIFARFFELKTERAWKRVSLFQHLGLLSDYFVSLLYGPYLERTQEIKEIKEVGKLSCAFPKTEYWRIRKFNASTFYVGCKFGISNLHQVFFVYRIFILINRFSTYISHPCKSTRKNKPT